MSDIYTDLYQDLEPERYVRGSLPTPALLAGGLALEQYTERVLLKAGIGAQRPDEFRTPDQYGIAFSPDLLIWNGGVRHRPPMCQWLALPLCSTTSPKEQRLRPR